MFFIEKLKRFLTLKSKVDIRKSNEEVFRYPPFLKGIPATNVQDIVESQEELLKRIEFEVGQEAFNEYYLPCIKNYAEFVHYLPASEKHHHRGAGGLFRHGLEVGLNAIKYAKGKVFDIHIPPVEREENKPKWVLAAFLAGLNHDIGKPLSDYKVIDETGNHIWNPFVETIEKWCERNELDKYFLSWNEARYRKHESLSSVVSEKVISNESLAFLSTHSNSIIRSLFECITNQPTYDNKLYEIVEKSDHLSTEIDIKDAINRGENANLSIPVTKYIIDAIKHLNTKNEWGALFDDAPPLIILNKSLYLTAKGLDRVGQRLDEQKIPGVPLDNKNLSNFLVEHGLLVQREVGEGERSNVWPIYRKGSEKNIWALKFKDWSIIYAQEPLEIPNYSEKPFLATDVKKLNVTDVKHEAGSKSKSQENKVVNIDYSPVNNQNPEPPQVDSNESASTDLFTRNSTGENGRNETIEVKSFETPIVFFEDSTEKDSHPSTLSAKDNSTNHTDTPASVKPNAVPGNSNINQHGNVSPKSTKTPDDKRVKSKNNCSPVNNQNNLGASITKNEILNTEDAARKRSETDNEKNTKNSDNEEKVELKSASKQRHTINDKSECSPVNIQSELKPSNNSGQAITTQNEKKSITDTLSSGELKAISAKGFLKAISVIKGKKYLSWTRLPKTAQKPEMIKSLIEKRILEKTNGEIIAIINSNPYVLLSNEFANSEFLKKHLNDLKAVVRDKSKSQKLSTHRQPSKRNRVKRNDGANTASTLEENAHNTKSTKNGLKRICEAPVAENNDSKDQVEMIPLMGVKQKIKQSESKTILMELFGQLEKGHLDRSDFLTKAKKIDYGFFKKITKG